MGDLICYFRVVYMNDIWLKFKGGECFCVSCLKLVV